MSDYLRLSLTPPAGDIPSTGFIDIFYDAGNSTLATRDRDGDIVSILRSTSIPDVSTAATPNTVVKRDVAGGITVGSITSSSISVSADGGIEIEADTPGLFTAALGLSGHGVVFGEVSSEKTVSLAFAANTLTAERTVNFVDASGAFPVVPIYTDLTAANTAEDAGVYYWDKTLKRLMVTTA